MAAAVFRFEFVGHVKDLFDYIIERDITKLFHVNIMRHLKYKVLPSHSVNRLAYIQKSGGGLQSCKITKG